MPSGPTRESLFNASKQLVENAGPGKDDINITFPRIAADSSSAKAFLSHSLASVSIFMIVQSALSDTGARIQS